MQALILGAVDLGDKQEIKTIKNMLDFFFYNKSEGIFCTGEDAFVNV